MNISMKCLSSCICSKASGARSQADGIQTKALVIDQYIASVWLGVSYVSLFRIYNCLKLRTVRRAWVRIVPGHHINTLHYYRHHPIGRLYANSLEKLEKRRLVQICHDPPLELFLALQPVP